MALNRPVNTDSLTLVLLLSFLCICHVTSSEELDQAPQNLISVETAYTFIHISWDPPQANASEVEQYLVKSHPTNNATAFKDDSHTIPNGTTSAYVRSLSPGTLYTVWVVAKYENGRLANSQSLFEKTRGFGNDNPCVCDPWGSAMPISCDYRTGQCVCQNKQTMGKRCDRCHPGYYVHEHKGCQACHCLPKISDGTCRVEKSGVVMCNCIPGHAGVQCTLCENGLYQMRGKCTPCKCNGNANETSPKICDGRTGKCLACIHNTMGDSCEKCLPGYEGSAIYQNCTRIEPVSGGASHMSIVIISVCFAVLAVAVLVILACTCRWLRWRWPSDKRFSFWSVQLRDDRENVNFSALADQPDCHVGDGALLNGDHVEFGPSKTALQFKSHGACS